MSGSSDGSAAILVLGFESADHELGPWLSRAVDICRSRNGELRDEQQHDAEQPSGEPPSYAAPTSGTLSLDSGSSTRHSRPRSPGIGSGSSTRACSRQPEPPCVRRAGAVRSLAVSHTCTRTDLHRITPSSTRPADPVKNSSNGTRSSSRLQRRSSPWAARSPITTPWGATNVSGTYGRFLSCSSTRSGPQSRSWIPVGS